MDCLLLVAVVIALLATFATAMVRDDREWKRDMERRMQFLDALERINDDR